MEGVGGDLRDNFVLLEGSSWDRFTGDGAVQLFGFTFGTLDGKLLVLEVEDAFEAELLGHSNKRI